MRVHNLVYHFKVAIGLADHFTLTLSMPKMVVAPEPKALVKLQSGPSSVSLLIEANAEVKVNAEQMSK